ncbi:hypothetical protein [Algiphilus sp.]|uniref:hypothetical protein n=1 Tax=Algiphilus sp. TaxID=1872431 RepID=UPI0025C1CE46|nr:hypothetical protein [Algiphilus sp.]MCK5770107.1 hypothetical protein [Algiphilus sp.]
MKGSRRDIENLFQTQGMEGRYREFAARPGDSRPAPSPSVDAAPTSEPAQADPAARDERATTSRPQQVVRRLGLVRSRDRRTPQSNAAPDAARSGKAESLSQLFAALSAAADARDGHAHPESAPLDAEQLRTLPLGELFARLDSDSQS